MPIRYKNIIKILKKLKNINVDELEEVLEPGYDHEGYKDKTRFDGFQFFLCSTETGEAFYTRKRFYVIRNLIGDHPDTTLTGLAEEDADVLEYLPEESKKKGFMRTGEIMKIKGDDNEVVFLEPYIFSKKDVVKIKNKLSRALSEIQNKSIGTQRKLSI